MVAWEYCRNIATLFKKLLKEKIFLVAVEQNEKAINYKNLKTRFPIALIFGNEIRGISPQILKKCDEIVEIPMHGKKESLNVSVAAGIILFSI